MHDLHHGMDDGAAFSVLPGASYTDTLGTTWIVMEAAWPNGYRIQFETAFNGKPSFPLRAADLAARAMA